MDIKTDAGRENQTKVQVFCLHFDKIWHPWRTQYHACNNRFIMSNYFTADIGIRTGFAKAAEFVQSAKNNPVLLFGFPPVTIPFNFSVSLSQMKENRFLIKFMIYYF